MVKYVVRINTETRYIKRDPEDHSIAEVDDEDNLVLTTDLTEALCLSSWMDMLAERSILLMERDYFDGEVEVFDVGDPKDEYAIRAAWEGHGYPKYVKRDPEAHDETALEENGVYILTRLIYDAYHTPRVAKANAVRILLMAELEDSFGGEVNVVNLRRGNE